MNLLFFQNIISPHQMPYIQHLPQMEGVDDVIVVVPEVSIDERESLGWAVEKWLQAEGVRFIISPTLEDVEKLFKDYSRMDTRCLFSGINAFQAVSGWLRLSLKYNIRRGVITEPPYVYDHPLWQHAIRFALKDWWYVKYINKIFVMGEDYLNYYRFWSKRWEVIPFMYCTEWKERSSQVRERGERLHIIYVGSLSHRKNVRCLFQAVALLSPAQQEQLVIGVVGDGEQRKELEALSKNIACEKAFFGLLPMEHVPAIMEQYDVLVLPSLHDGWGAVVNEALTLGLYVICSDHCGAKMLLKREDNGAVFKSNEIKSLATIISNAIQRREEISRGVSRRIDWCGEHISEKAVAEYFVSVLRR